MDRRTVAVYAGAARRYEQARRTTSPGRARALGRAAPRGAVRVDLGCGPGLATALLGRPVVALDAVQEMVALARGRVPWAAPVVADLEALPFRRGAVGASWASKSYQHVARERLPLALAHLHHALAVDAPAGFVLFEGEGARRSDDDLPGRLFSLWERGELADLLTGAGFVVDRIRRRGHHLEIDARRARSLPDTVGPGMRLLICGLNPSLHAADAGVGFARPGNRFWPAALRAGILGRDRDPFDALRSHGVGMTDLVKRATARAHELDASEYRAGLARIERLVAWLRPGAVVMVGLSGWRTAADAAAVPGPQARLLGGVPVYVMPSTSGANAHASAAALAEHLRAAARLAEPAVSRRRTRSARARRPSTPRARPAR